MPTNSNIYDINQLPMEKGMLVFGISMSKISTAQKPEKCFEYVSSLVKKILHSGGVGLTFLYTDSLYMHSDKPADELRQKYLGAVTTHANGFRKIIGKNVTLIPQAFSYVTWSQMLLHCKDFQVLLGKLQKIYEKDPVLQQCVLRDARNANISLTNHDIQFILEESVVLHLIAKGKAEFHNEFLQGKEEWILNCYPGKPLMTETYLAQKNPFKLKNPLNKYEFCSYDLEEKKLYDLREIELPG